MRWIAVAAAMAVGTWSAATAQEVEPEPGQDRLVRVSAPTAKDDAKIFPKGAPVSGGVALRCTLTAQGAPTDCTVVREDPPGGGLLAAALQEVSLFKFKPLDRDGRPVAGRKVVLNQFYMAPGDKNPDWLRKPNANTIAGVHPVRAMREGRSGTATISCKVTVNGFLDRCTVASESPEGYGFGEAALILSKQFAMTPTIRGGKAVEGSVRIPINWEGGGGGQAVSRQRLMVDPPWAKTPSPAQVAAAWPSKAGDLPSGQAALRCDITKAGATTGCEVVSEIPPGRGFAAAAKSLAPHFVMQFKPEQAELVKNLSVDIPFRFRNPATPDNARITEATWLTTLSPQGAALLFPKAARDAGLLTGLGVVDCAATATGEFTDCRVSREDPVEKGFGAAGLEAVKYMRMNPWTKGGDPVEGRRVLLPIRLQLEDPKEAAAAAAKQPTP